MVLTIDKTHELKGNGYLLGVAAENESEQLIINIAYDTLLNKWAYNPTLANEHGVFLTNGLDAIIKKPKTSYDVACVKTTKYDANNWHNLWENKTNGVAVRISATYSLVVVDLGYTDAATFKDAMVGVMLLYELATPIETDISAYLTDNYIRVEPNGTIIFENDNAQAVPSEIIYTVKR